MMPFMHGPFMGAFGFSPFGAVFGTGFALFALILVLWGIFWKGLALWHAARNGEWIWFVVFLFVNTVGILEIIYLVFFRNNKDSASIFPWNKPSASPITIVEETLVINETPSDGSSAT